MGFDFIMIVPLLQSHCSFFFVFGCGVSFFFFLGRFQHPPVDGCSTASCDFGALTGGAECMSFYSAILNQKHLFLICCLSLSWGFPSGASSQERKDSAKSCLTLSQPHGLAGARVFCPWDSPAKNTRMGCHILLQGIFQTHGSNPGLLHCRQILLTTEPAGKPLK